MLPIRHNQQLIQRPDTLLIKVPEPLYQIWWDIALGMAQMDTPIEKRQEVLFKELTDWVQQKYPDYGIVSFEDLSREDARKVSAKTGHPITWGMYVLLQIGGSMQPVNIHQLLEEGQKLIEP